MFRPAPRFQLLSCLALLWVTSAEAVTVQIDAARDTMILSDLEDASSGRGDHVCVGRTAGPATRRALLVFDIAAAGIPPGSTIEAVTLELYMDNPAGGGGIFDLHRVTASWGEGNSNAPGGGCMGAAARANDATWRWRLYDPEDVASSVLWTNLGADFVAGASASSDLDAEIDYKSWSSAQMAADVQLWLDNPGTDFGWLLKRASEAGMSNAMRFASRENALANRRPKLIIDYTPAAVSGACCLPGQSCQIASAVDCAAMGGSFQGAGSGCTPNPCPPDPTGACCTADGSCSVVTSTGCTDQGGTFQGGGVSCSEVECPLLLEPFVDALPIPQPAQPDSGSSGAAASYVLVMREVQQQLHRDLPPTTVWGYGQGANGATSPGPTIEAWADQPVSVAWVNDLRDSSQVGDPPPYRQNHYFPVAGLGPPPSCMIHGAEDVAKAVVHLHGAHVEAAFDGYPEENYLPGQQRVYSYRNHQLPATLWYHDHALGITRLNVYLGLSGFYLIRDSFEQSLGLPACPNPSQAETCYEIPLAIQDRSFNPDGSLKYAAQWQDHFFGDKILVNGKVWPFHDVRQGKYRFRLLNGSGSRTLTLSLDRSDLPGPADLAFWQIGTDGGLIELPLELDAVTLAPAERVDVVVDFAGLAPGTEVRLVNSAPAPYPGSAGSGVVPDVLKFVVQDQTGHTAPIPASLRPFDPIDELEAIRSRDFVLDKESDDCGAIWKINGLKWDDIVEYPQLGTTEIWRFVNPGNTMHPMHMHLVMFQVLDRTPIGGGSPVPPDPSEIGWKDTARAEPNTVTRVIARFEDYPGKFAYHCHILEHEDHEMMRQFWAVDAVRIELGASGAGWTAQPGAASFDVVRGDLGELVASGGNYALSSVTAECVADELVATSLPLPGEPDAGHGYWYLVRSNGSAGASTYDSGSSSQAGLRDAAILASGNDCP